jgi:hypothetical protein
MKTISQVVHDSGDVRHGGVAVHFPAQGSWYGLVAKRQTTALEGSMEGASPLRKVVAWVVAAAKSAARIFAAYLPWSKDPVPGWDPMIKCWNKLGVPHEKARPPNPKKEAHHSHGKQTEF